MNIIRRAGKTITACFVAFNLFAQNTETYQTSIYFNSGKAEIDEAAMAAMEQFLQKISPLQDFELDIRAYTDDIGSDKYNLGLAGKRAEAVRQHLANKNIQAFDTQVSGLGEIALEDKTNAEENRRQNRRVDIVVTPFAPQNLSDFYGFFQKRHTQHFCIRNHRDTTILGSKGTVLFIPAGAFQTADGKLVNQPVHIELQEAYSYQDMLLHNLATISDGELLETGGMVHIAAQLAGGQAVEVKKGMELSLSMPTDATGDDGMKLFVADRPANTPAAPINWTTNNRGFLPGTFEVLPPNFAFSAVKMDAAPLLEALPLPTFPQPIPAAPTMPQKPYLSPDNKPSKEALAKIYTKEKNESESEYQARLEERFASAQRIYQEKMEMNKTVLARYEKDMENYKTALAKHNENAALQQKIASDYRMYLVENRGKIMNWVDNFRISKGGLLPKAIHLVKQTQMLGDYRNFLVQECQRFGLNKEAEIVQGFNLLETNDLMRDIARKFIRCGNTNQQLVEKRIPFSSEGILRMINELNSTSYGIIFNSQKQKNEHSLEEMHNILTGYNNQIALFNEIIENYNEVVTKTGFFEQAQALEQICKQLDPTYNILMEKRLENAKSVAETKNIYLRTVGIDKLGWVNCDKFGSIPQNEKMALQLPIQGNETMSFFAVFKNIRSVMPFHYGGDIKNFITLGLPKNQQVTVIGIRVINGKTEICVEEGKVLEMGSKQYNFRAATLSEVRDLLNV